MADQNEIMQRREDIMASLLRGRSTREIIRAMTNHYDVSKATIERDISQCYNDIRKNYDRTVSDVVSMHVSKYEEIHKSAMEIGDFRSAIASLQAIEKLLKMHSEQPLVAIQQNNINLDNLSLEELLKILSQSNTIGM